MAQEECTKKDTLLVRSRILLESLAKLQGSLVLLFDRGRPDAGGEVKPKQQESNVLDELGNNLTQAVDRVGSIAEFLRDRVFQKLE